MLELLFAFLEPLLQAALENMIARMSPRSFVLILVMIYSYAVLRDALPFDKATASFWAIIITASLAIVYYLFQIPHRRTKQMQNELSSPSDSPENIN